MEISWVKFEKQILKKINEVYPCIPIMDKGQIITKVSEEIKKDMNRLAEAKLEGCITTITVAHIRHKYTDYDKRIRPFNKTEARREISPKVKEIIGKWRGHLNMRQ